MRVDDLCLKKNEQTQNKHQNWVVFCTVMA